VTVAAQIFEDNLLTKVAQQYRDKGYQVFIEPRSIGLEGIPDNWRLDIVAHSNHETVVVEITSRERLNQYPDRLVTLAQAIEQKSGWRLETIVLGETHSDIPLEPANLPILNRADILNAVKTAETALLNENLATAFDNIWEGLEGITRLLLEADEIDMGNTSLFAILKTLISQGYLPQEDYDTLKRGVISTQDQTDNLDAPFIQQLIDMVSRLLEEVPDK
jgi:REase_AHJR-like